MFVFGVGILLASQSKNKWLRLLGGLAAGSYAGFAVEEAYSKRIDGGAEAPRTGIPGLIGTVIGGYAAYKFKP